MFFYYILTIPLFFYIPPILNIYSTQLILTFTPLLYLLFLIILHSSTYCYPFCSTPPLFVINCIPLLHFFLQTILNSSTYCCNCTPLLHLLLSIVLHSSIYCCNCTPLLHLLLSIVLHSSTYCYQMFSTPPFIVINCTPLLHLLLSIVLHSSTYCYQLYSTPPLLHLLLSNVLLHVSYQFYCVIYYSTLIIVNSTPCLPLLLSEFSFSEYC